MKSLKEKIEVMQACLDGKHIQYRDQFLHGKENDGDWERSIIGGDFSWNWDKYDYRVEPEPKVKRTVPLEVSDIPPVCWIRWIITPVYSELVVNVCPHGLKTYKSALLTWGYLAGACQYSTDLKTWLPCSKEVEE